MDRTVIGPRQISRVPTRICVANTCVISCVTRGPIPATAVVTFNTFWLLSNTFGPKTVVKTRPVAQRRFDKRLWKKANMPVKNVRYYLKLLAKRLARLPFYYFKTTLFNYKFYGCVVQTVTCIVHAF